MKFCEKCGNLLIAVKKRKRTYFVCRKCGREYRLKGEKLTIGKKIPIEKKNVIVMGKDEGLAELPKTKIMCPKCENMEAYWWMQQTRSEDEPPTMFYLCTKCKHSWRTYG
jgi:DNA-directed RNA polymerase subunit M